MKDEVKTSTGKKQVSAQEHSRTRELELERQRIVEAYRKRKKLKAAA